MEILRQSLGPDQMPLLLIEGVGPKVAELKALIESGGLGSFVRYVGTEPHVFDLLNAIDVVVLPSISHEDFPNVTIEAMSLARVVVASRLAGLPEQIEDDESGLLFTPGDADELARALTRVVTDPELRLRLSRNALSRYNNEFREDIAVSRYVRLYEELRGANSGGQ
jgi:glycosyltransferase involved in cell wall biosynthesis